MKKFLSLFLALILVVGLLVPAVSAEPAETETKALVTWTGGTSLTNNGTGDVLSDVELAMFDSSDQLNAYGSLGVATSTYGNLTAQPWYGTKNFSATEKYGYLQFAVKTTDYENLVLRSTLGNNGKAPSSFKVEISTDGGTT